MKELLYLKNVATLKLDPAKCTGCGMCLDVCPRAVLARTNGKVTITALDACIECGACQQNCPVHALSVRVGVGCAQAIINAALGRTSSGCCCTVESREQSDTTALSCGSAGTPSDGPSDKPSCGSSQSGCC